MALVFHMIGVEFLRSEHEQHVIEFELIAKDDLAKTIPPFAYVVEWWLSGDVGSLVQGSAMCNGSLFYFHHRAG